MGSVDGSLDGWVGLMEAKEGMSSPNALGNSLHYLFGLDDMAAHR